MSVYTYYNPNSQLNNSRFSSQWQCIIGHGGAQTHFTTKHPLIQYTYNILHIPVVHSIELPGHGTNTYSQLDASNPDKVIQQCIDELNHMIVPLLNTNRHTLFLCYSLSTLFLLTQWLYYDGIAQKNKIQLHAILFGSALGQSDIHESFATRRYRNTAVYTQPNEIDTMKSMHGVHYENNVRLSEILISSAHGGHGIFLTADQRKALLSTRPNIHFIHALNDLVCPLDQCILPYLNKEQCVVHVATINNADINHFNMFAQTGWPTSKTYIDIVVTNYIHDLLPIKQLIIPTTTINHTVRTYVRESYVINNIDPDEWQCVCVHGGGQGRWTHSHGVVRLMMEYVNIIHSLLLPLHEKRTDNIDMNNSVHDVLNIIWNELRPLIAGRKTILIAYSISSLNLLKLLPQIHESASDFRLILIGTSLCSPGTPQCNYIHTYWQPSQFQQSGTAELMIKMHGKQQWIDMCRYIGDSSGTAESLLWLTQSERNHIFSTHICDKLYIVQGDDEVAFLPELCIYNVCDTQWLITHVTLIHNCTHFIYFNKLMWPHTSRRIRSILKLTLPELQSIIQPDTTFDSKL